ncbi:hypothetical protein [Alicyclobacillus sp.]|uniref:hypothetical protein n=1 Tax=Alicyclobacillus sp. TaxID=61169 RepID=UPI0025C59F1C|nr:hypothetical protein [Alicyclobacillus sp.]MCL6517655.1 hypothetical protein [Alicyclobacillus sp.]
MNPQSAPTGNTTSTLRDRLLASARDAIAEVLARVGPVEQRVLGQLAQWLWPRLEQAIRSANEARLREELERWRQRIDAVLQDAPAGETAPDPPRPRGRGGTGRGSRSARARVRDRRVKAGAGRGRVNARSQHGMVR